MATTTMICGCIICRDQITEEYELEYCTAHEANWQVVSKLEAEIAYHKYHYELIQKDYNEHVAYWKQVYEAVTKDYEELKNQYYTEMEALHDY